MSEDQNKTPVKHSSAQLASKISAYLALIIAIVAGILAFMSYHSTSTQNRQIQKNQHQMLIQLQQTQGDYHNQLTERFNKNETLLNQLIAKTINAPAEQAKTEANYLMHLAELNLTYGNNVRSALYLLQIAEQQLAPFHTPDTEAMQLQLKANIEKLQKISSTNPIQLLNTLNNLSKQIQQIPIIPAPPTPTCSKAVTANNSTSMSWWQKVKNNLTKLQSFIIIRKIDDPNSLALTPDKKLLLTQSILFKLSLAQWAILNKQPTVYVHSLQTAQKMLIAIPIAASSRAELDQTFNQLLAEKITPKTFTLLPATRND